jgi:deoxyribodipyrimidine photo-lyase
MYRVNSNRCNIIHKSSTAKNNNIAYWMSRDQRITDNWALLTALNLGYKYKSQVRIVFCISPQFLNATLRQYDFMLKSLLIEQQKAIQLNIFFDIIIGEPTQTIPKYLQENNSTTLVTDYSPLKIKSTWLDSLHHLDLNICEVDSHNVIPVWQASDKQEFAAYTIRRKIGKQILAYLDEFPKLKYYPNNENINSKIWDYESIIKNLAIDKSVLPSTKYLPGIENAKDICDNFIQSKLQNYDSDRNNVNIDGQSNLSPFLHFGQISSQSILLKLIKHFGIEILINIFETWQTGKMYISDLGAFVEELIVRKELADNYCHYNKNYDNYNGFPDWAKTTLNEHRDDVRDHVYDLETFEQSQTHDPIWNAAQSDLVNNGKLHGYLRMLWAKKILEWSESPEQAQQIAIYLNDKYELDGRDPNGYVGIAWSIGGLHDRPWFDRKIFGKVRYMTSKKELMIGQ